MKKLILFSISIALLLSGCTSSEKTGNFQLYLTDQPVEADEIWAYISKIEVQKTGEAFFPIWENWEDPKEFDLLKIMNKKELVLDTTLEEGMYTQIRLVVVSGRIKFKGEDDYHNMTVPSSEVKIPLVFNVMEDSSVEVVLDFEADQSVDVVYTGQNAEYLLKPVIRVANISY